MRTPLGPRMRVCTMEVSLYLVSGKISSRRANTYSAFLAQHGHISGDRSGLLCVGEKACLATSNLVEVAGHFSQKTADSPQYASSISACMHRVWNCTRSRAGSLAKKSYYAAKMSNC